MAIALVEINILKVAWEAASWDLGLVCQHLIVTSFTLRELFRTATPGLLASALSGDW